MQATRRAARALVLASALFAVGAGVAASQATGSGPALSSDEQAVYAMVINSWLGQDHGMQRVNLRLGPAPSAASPDYAECAKGLRFAKDSGGSPAERTLDDAHFHLANIELVDGETWQATDPEQGIGQGKSVEAAVNEGVSRSLVTLSQIAFSADGRDGLVSFSMVCGRLCGTGFTLQVHKSKTHWRIARRCGGYIS